MTSPEFRNIPSFREYLDILAEVGDIVYIDDELNTNLEVGAAIRYCAENEYSAPLFSNFERRYKSRILGNPAGLTKIGYRWQRPLLSLGIDVWEHPLTAVRKMASVRKREGIKSTIVTEACVQDHVLLGDDANLDDFPIPLIHDGDGGRYANTWGTIVVQSPDGRWTNWSIARVMKAGPHKMAGMLRPAQDVGKIHAMWKELGQDMPFAIVQGCAPDIPFVCAMGLPSGHSEVDYIGALRGKPVQVVNCKTVPLTVPADAEVVIEGTVSNTETLPEGPMGEYAGYISGTTRNWPAMSITAITYRDDPIWPVVSAGKPVEEDHTAIGISYSAECLHRLTDAGLPVSDVWLQPESALNMLIISVHQDWRSKFYSSSTAVLTRAIASVALQPKVGFWATRVMVVDSDIDITDLRDVSWAFSTRCHPAYGQLAIENQHVTPLHVMYKPSELVDGATKTAYDCLLGDKETRPISTAFDKNFSEDIKSKIISVVDKSKGVR